MCKKQTILDFEGAKDMLSFCLYAPYKYLCIFIN